MRLEGRTALVTGASRGLGRAIALALAEEGVSVVLAARDGEALEAVAATIAEIGGQALVVRCDVRDPTAVRALADRTLRRFGRIDCAVNSAGAALRRPFGELSLAEWNDLFATQVAGAFLVAQAVLPTMIAAGRGNIINLTPPPDGTEISGWTAYSSAAYALSGLTRTLAAEVRPLGINVNGLHPGGFADTETGRAMTSDSGSTERLLDPSVVTPAAIALAAQPPRGLSGTLVDAIAWNTDQGLGAGLG